MGTVTGTGVSTEADSRMAAARCTEQALKGLGGVQPLLGLLFAGSKHELGPALRVARDTAKGAEILGCTTAGEITEKGLTHDGMSMMLIASDEMVLNTASAGGLAGNHLEAAKELCREFTPAAGKARVAGLPFSTTIALIDGLSGVGEKLIAEILSSTQPMQQVVGGAAGDDGAFKSTWVGRGAEAMKNSAAVVHTFGKKKWGVGVGHGLEPTTEPMRVTSSNGNVLFELDGKPAFDAYVEHAKKRGIDLKKETVGDYMICNELGVFRRDKICKARAPLSVGADGSLTLAADIAFGASVAILDGKADAMIRAATGAAEEAKRNLEGAKPAGVLLFDCICRGIILKDAFQREIDAVRSVLGEVPVCGFLTYGEIANYKGKLDHWHNTTAVVVALPA